MNTVARLPAGPLPTYDSVLETLRRMIILGNLPPGSKLVQENLAAELRISRIPLREALRTLEGEGLVIFEPNRGAVCRPLEAKDIADLYAVRLALEELAIREAASAYVDLRESTKAGQSAARAAVRRKDMAALIGLDRDFHASITAGTRNTQLVRSLETYWSQIMRAMHIYLRIDTIPENVWAEHVALAEAINFGDAAGAVELFHKHISHSSDAILKTLRGKH